MDLVINLSQDEIRIYDPTDLTRSRQYPGAVVSGTYRATCFVYTLMESE